MIFESRGEKLPATLYNESRVGVVLCPPHPLFGGGRKDTRLVRVAEELASHNISALCIDYGSYGQGKREVQNILDAISYLKEKVHPTGLLGYSFRAMAASNAAARAEVKGFVAMRFAQKLITFGHLSPRRIFKHFTEMPPKCSSPKRSKLNCLV